MLELGIVRNAEGSTERKFAVEGTRRLHLLDHWPHGGESDRGQTGFFHHVGEHTHGARAEWSNGCEDHDVDAVALQLLGGAWPAVEADGGHIVGLITGERKMPRCDSADDTIFL